MSLTKASYSMIKGAVVNVLDFGADPTGVIDSQPAIQSAIDYACQQGTEGVGNIVWIPVGTYKINSGIILTNDLGAGTSQVALQGAGVAATTIKPNGNFTALKFVSSYVDCGDFSIVWEDAIASSIPTTRIGIEFAGANFQTALATIKHIYVRSAYNGFVLNNWTGSPYGTMYDVTLSHLTTMRCANWGFYLNSKVGSTTLHIENCYARCDDITGNAKGKGYYINNFDDVLCNQLILDLALDDWISIQNAQQCQLIGTAFESNAISIANGIGVVFQCTSVIISGCKIVNSLITATGTVNYFFPGGNTYNFSIAGYAEAFTTNTNGATIYVIKVNSAASKVSINDTSILQPRVNNSGWYANITYNGVTQSSSGSAPSYGTWALGDYVKNGVPQVGQPKGWYCTVAGTPGTWVSEGNL